MCHSSKCVFVRRRHARYDGNLPKLFFVAINKIENHFIIACGEHRRKRRCVDSHVS